jgi:hypothetical protein
MPRFVLLYHECPPDYPRPSHWDLMLEAGDALRTWALPMLPRDWQTAQSHTVSMFPACAAASMANIVDAEPLGDHRRDYLEYEGRLTGERGLVTRIDGGNFDTLAESEQFWRLALHGGRVRGGITLTAGVMNASSWKLTWEGPD